MARALVLVLAFVLSACGPDGEPTSGAELIPGEPPAAAPPARPAPEPAEEGEAIDEPTPDPPDPAPAVERPPRPRRPSKRGRLRASDRCRRERSRAATETLCDADGNCDSPRVSPECR